MLAGFSATLPFAASIAGPKVSTIDVDDPAACHKATGSAPFIAFPQRCEVRWTIGPDQATGMLYGRAVDDLAAGSNTPQSAVYQLGDFAFTAPVGDGELRMALLAPLVLLIGLYLLIGRRRGHPGRQSQGRRYQRGSRVGTGGNAESGGDQGGSSSGSSSGGDSSSGGYGGGGSSGGGYGGYDSDGGYGGYDSAGSYDDGGGYGGGGDGGGGGD